MIANWFYDIHEWVIFLAMAIAFLACAALGRRIGRSFRRSSNLEALIRRGVAARENPVR